MIKQSSNVRTNSQFGKYKSSKLWLTMGVTSVALGVTTFAANPIGLNAKADTADNTSQTTASSTALAGNSTTLRTSNSAPTAADTGSEKDTPAANTPRKQSAELAKATPAKPATGTSATASEDSSAPATTTMVPENVKPAAKEAEQPSETKVTNLGDATSDEIANAKAKAATDFDQTGVAQTVTAVSPASVVKNTYTVLFRSSYSTIAGQSTLDLTEDEFNNGTYAKPELAGYYTINTKSEKGLQGAQVEIGGNLYPGTYIEANVVPLSSLMTVNIQYSIGEPASVRMTVGDFVNYKYTSGDVVDQNLHLSLLGDHFPGFDVTKVTTSIQPTLGIWGSLMGKMQVDVQSKYSDAESFRSAYFIGNNLVSKGMGTTDYFTIQTPLVQIPNILDTLSIINGIVPDATLNLDNSKITFTKDGVSKDLTFNDYFKQVLGVDLSASDAELKAVEQKTETRVANADSLSKIYISKITANGALEQAYEKAIKTHNPLDVYDFLARASVAFSTDTMQVGGKTSDWYTQYAMEQSKTAVGEPVSVNPSDYYDNSKNNGSNPPTDHPTNPNKDNGGGNPTTDQPTPPTTNNEVPSNTNAVPSNNSSNGNAVTNTEKTSNNSTQNRPSNRESENGTVEKNTVKNGNASTLPASNQVEQEANHAVNAQKLPQTHEASDRMAMTVGSILLTLAAGLLGLGFKRRKQTK
ncbi:hypothetical protein [Secundilactobacillus mixtipabuli]|uniref:Gram-positive cocci surface proteins LPxTG domain-containing protein n=1 Tax=Secundilactobacillus mixtipabuli TaxID=1435342 RepID=A0A1Z5IA38_9LACO|nr:hypothetical protein [Secundilactobacillus mixtipabuli]GAW98488.1 hypothetical protein IWT30_00433 [Secundilactobacillus mixtipabuli]